MYATPGVACEIVLASMGGCPLVSHATGGTVWHARLGSPFRKFISLSPVNGDYPPMLHILYSTNFFSALSSSWWFLYTALFTGLVSTVTSAYLMYILVYVLETICLVCVPVHVINVLLLLLYTLKWRTVNARQIKGGKKHKKEHKD